MSVAPDGRRMLRVEARNAEVPIERKPAWIRTRASMGPQYTELQQLVRGGGLHTELLRIKIGLSDSRSEARFL